MVSLLFILSILPILTVVISILLFKQPIAKALITGIIITFLLNIYVWKADETIVNNLFDVQFNLINHGIDKSHYGRVLFFAFFDSLETVLIISSAILLFKIVIDNGSIRQYVKILEKLSSDIVYLTIFFCFFLGNLFESISSYGVAQALIAPIIYALGLPVTTSVGITLIATIPIYYMNSFNNPSIVGFNVLKLIGYSSQEYFAIIKSSI
ncbi:MAG: L-lactate permease, partial [Candidatus Anstonellales archaeon]